jgi:SEC-C motif-containing protein
MPRSSQPLNRCPCGADAPYAGCCGLYLDGDQVPATAEALMRSRYVAYVQRRSDYLLQTWHSTQYCSAHLLGRQNKVSMFIIHRMK